MMSPSIGPESGFAVPPLKNSRLQEDRLILMARPLGQIIVKIDHPHAIEDVAGWHESFRNLRRDPKIEERWKRKPHMASFIRKGSAAQGATHLARKNSLMLIELAVIENEVIHPRQNSDMVFVKYRCPLHGRTVQLLADSAMTYL